MSDEFENTFLKNIVEKSALVEKTKRCNIIVICATILLSVIIICSTTLFIFANYEIEFTTETVEEIIEETIDEICVDNGSTATLIKAENSNNIIVGDENKINEDK